MFSSVSLIFKMLSTVLTRNLLFIEMSALNVPSTVTTITKYFPTSLTAELFHRRVDFFVNEFLQIDSRICENENQKIKKLMSILFIGKVNLRCSIFPGELFDNVLRLIVYFCRICHISSKQPGPRKSERIWHGADSCCDHWKSSNKLDI